MKNTVLLQYKIKIGILLSILIGLILFNNILSRTNLNNASNSSSSIFNDRLMAATYIFEITNHLYEKQLGLQNGESKHQSLQHDAAINELVEKYETTKLTTDESGYWTAFKENLDNYKKSIGTQNSELFSFEKTIQNLKQLSDIQANEGKHLSVDTSTSLNFSTMGTYFEIGISFLIGLFVLMLVGISKSTITTLHQQSSLN